MDDRDATPPPLLEKDVPADPMRLFRDWFQAARGTAMREPTAVTLATADRQGRPSARIVLLKGSDDDRFVFFTNYESRKGRELAENPYAALVFYWDELRRQVRAAGPVSRTSRRESEEYFHSRPFLSQIGALTSRQSRVIENRDELLRRFEALVEEHRNQGPVPLPEYWGGFQLVPETIEFWNNQPNRLHDRIRYTRTDRDAPWRIERLSP